MTKPILFAAPMVLALLREIAEPGTGKTQTRRALKPQPETTAGRVSWQSRKGYWCAGVPVQDFASAAVQFAPYQPGDRLWVREALKLDESDHLLYAADATPVPHGCIPDDFSVSRRSVPGMFMCRWASRLTLVVTDVRVQRLQEISEEDAKAEGIGFDFSRDPLASARNACWWASAINSRRGFNSARAAFHELWDSLNARRGFSWEGNPWVVAVTFKPYLCNIDKSSGLSPETAAKEADDAAE
jgi:hypothetical protein